MALWPALDCNGMLVCWFVCWNLSIAGRKFFRKLLFLKKFDVYKWTCDEHAEKHLDPIYPHLVVSTSATRATCSMVWKTSWKGLDLASQVPQLTPSLASLPVIPCQHPETPPKHLRVLGLLPGVLGSTNFHRFLTRYGGFWKRLQLQMKSTWN